jgi:hypothetical protein
MEETRKNNAAVSKVDLIVFWLSDRSSVCNLPKQVSLLSGCTLLLKRVQANVVPDYSGGPVTDFHRVPYQIRRLLSSG